MKIIRAFLDEQKSPLCFGFSRFLKVYGEGRQARPLPLTVYTSDVAVETKRLASIGVAVSEIGWITDLDRVPTPYVIEPIRGIDPKRRESLKGAGVDVAAAACPFLTAFDKKAVALLDENYIVVFAGVSTPTFIPTLLDIFPKHPGRVLFAPTPESVDALAVKRTDRVAVISRTTQWHTTFQPIVQRLMERVNDLRVVSTMCVDTGSRIPYAAEIASRCDVLVVLGDNSTAKEIENVCGKNGCRVHRVLGPDGVEPGWFAGADVVGVIGGNAETAEMITEICARIEGAAAAV